MCALIINFTVAVALLCNDVGAARVLGLFPHTGRSHQMVFEPLLEELAKRGHQVTVISFFPLKNPPPNYTDVSLEGIAPIGIETFDLEYADFSPTILKLIGLDGIFNQIMGFHPLAEMALNVCEKLVHHPVLKDTLKKRYDVVLVENFSSDCMIGLAHAYGLDAPKIGLLSSNLLPWSTGRLGLFDNPSYVSIVSTDYTHSMGLLERCENSFMAAMFNVWFRYVIQVQEQKLIEDSFGRKVVDLNEVALNMTALMVNVFHSLHGVRPSVPGLIEVGGMHLKSDGKKIPHYIERFLEESEEGVILFSWGSLIKTATIPPEKEEIIVNALAKFPQRVIWKYENSEPEGNLTGNILRVNWIPQYELLRHKKVVAFIAHGGLLGMTEAVSAGKPMLVVPFFGDQPNNGAFAAAAGFATVLRYPDITEKSLQEALQKVLSAPMRLAARKASKIWHDRPMHPLDTAVYWVERVARWGHSDPLHLPARDMPLYERALLDVIATIVLALVILLLVLRLIVKFIIKSLLGILVKEKKTKVH